MKHRKLILQAILFLALPIYGLAQRKEITEEEQVWLGYFNQTRFSEKWGGWTDVHLRTKENFFTQFSQGLVRVGLTYYINNDTKLTAGYSYVHHFPADNHKNISQPEHRPWQQLQWHTRFQKLRIMQWFRLEERFRRKILNDNELADGYHFNFRGRHNILGQFALCSQPFKPGTFSFVLSDEVFLNFGKQIVYNTFDQNRLFAGFAYYLNDHDNLQFGYMNLFQQQASGNRYRSLHVARIFFFHNLDWRKRKEPAK
ncbi:DUF2490 domain-containing protein [Flavisolibacter sp. BT320]|nr:DUF2490 domain-containing protein [Flavisolibacter longurius]